MLSVVGYSHALFLLLASELFLYGNCACEEKIVPYPKKAVGNTDKENVLSNTTVETQSECRDVCCSTTQCEMAVFHGDKHEENCVLYHCPLGCEEMEKNSTVLLVKKVKVEAVEDLEALVEETAQEHPGEKLSNKSAMHLSKATAITLLVVGVLAFVTVIVFFTFKCVEWSPRRRYNRIDFLMNDVDE